MALIIFSDAAKNKITQEMEKHSHRPSAAFIARLQRYQRSYMTYNDGRFEEYGPGLLLTFAEMTEEDREDYLVVPFSSTDIYISPRDFFSGGTHLIDWDGCKFVAVEGE